VALASEKNHIAGGGLLERQPDGGGAVGFDSVFDFAGLQSGLDLGQNGCRFLGAGIVAGGHHKIASFASGQAHLRPLGAVAVTAAAENR
jgi:hypothetical protein